MGRRAVFGRGAGQATDEIERTVVGPVNIFEQQGNAALGGQGAHEAHEVGLGQGNEVRAAGQTGHRRAGRKVEAQPVADDIGLIGQQLHAGRIQPGPARRDKAVAELAQGNSRAVAVQDVEAEGEHVAPQAERHALQRRCRPPLEVAHKLRSKVNPVVELIEQAALAHARLADDGQDARPRLGHSLAKGGLERGQLGVAADHACLDPLHAAAVQPEGARLRPQHDVGRHRLMPPAHLDGA